MRTPSKPAPAYTHTRTPDCPEAKRTNTHVRVDHSSTNSPFADIELGNMPTTSEPLPAYTDTRFPPSQEQTSEHTRVDHTSTNSPTVDIELGNIVPPRPAHSRLETFRAMASKLTAPFSARAATFTRRPQAAPRQTAAPRRRPQRHTRRWSRCSCSWKGIWVIITALVLLLVLLNVVFAIFPYAYNYLSQRYNGGTGKDLQG
jgi:hypothetical protein